MVSCVDIMEAGLPCQKKLQGTSVNFGPGYWPLLLLLRLIQPLADLPEPGESQSWTFPPCGRNLHDECAHRDRRPGPGQA